MTKGNSFFPKRFRSITKGNRAVTRCLGVKTHRHCIVFRSDSIAADGNAVEFAVGYLRHVTDGDSKLTGGVGINTQCDRLTA